MRFYLILLCLILVSASVFASSELGSLPLTPERRIRPIEGDGEFGFLKQFNILSFALSMYYMDAKERLPKNEIKDKMALRSAPCKEAGVAFDMDNIDFKRKGFTRYYPFTVLGRDLIVRIFDMRDKGYLPEFEVFEEGAFHDSNIGFQIIPGINALLEKNKIEKISLSTPAEFSTAP